MVVSKLYMYGFFVGKDSIGFEPAIRDEKSFIRDGEAEYDNVVDCHSAWIENVILALMSWILHYV